MSLSWILLWSALLPLVRLSEVCPVHKTYTPQNESPLLDSLRCYNDYETTIFCTWKEHRNTTLWIQAFNGNRVQCLPDDAERQDASGMHRMSHCKYKTRELGIGIKHAAFFLQEKTETVCSSAPHKPVALSQHIRARPPVHLSTRDTGDGGRRLSWSSPYPASSPLCRNITYQLSYRAAGQEHWRTELVTNTELKLERRVLLPGHRYEARARAKASVGQWSHWSPVVTWQTEDNARQFPSLDCVLDGEQEVMCSWEVSTEQAHFITYQLLWRHSHAAQFEGCCLSPVVTSDPSRTVLKYTCALRSADPTHLLLQLRPAHAAKVFESIKHIRPNPPQNVSVKEKDNTWVVKWTESSSPSNLKLYYELCYYMIEDRKSEVFVNVSVGSLSLNILHTSLVPLKQYQVKVRSLLVPDQSSYRGIPSEWSQPVTWTEHEAELSPTTLIYLSISVLVVVIFITLYCTVVTCQRKVILWVDSVPSPRKSKIIPEMQVATSRALLQTEKILTCKVLHMDSVSTYCSDVSLWPASNCGKSLQQDEGCWTGVSQGSCDMEVNSSAMSAMSFSGPYIFCQASESKQSSVDVGCEETKKPPSSDESAPRPNLNLSLQREGYVCMPGHTQDQHRADATLQADTSEVQPSLSVEAFSSQEPPAYTPGPTTSWPQGGTIQVSGYLHIPTS